MTINGISRKAASLAIAMVLAAGILFVNPAPAAAACNSTEVWIEVLGTRYNSPTNGCVGPVDWNEIICTDGDTSFLNEDVVIGLGACLAWPI